ncbi:MAG TPA: peptide deformylase [Bacteroidales bacterium]|jgi:peptide deformylase|nr:peptide deformylase [Bacteroidales bacterium]HPK30122.1 peptide deformylase [Bacteroidales bacterium]
MILPIYLYGSQVLREKAVEADIEEREELTKLLDDMYETMKQADGCGLAAPQVGRSIRVLIVDGSDLADRYPELADFMRKMINPVFTFKSEEMSTYSEGCLSIPDVDAEIDRPKVVRIKYIDENFQEKEEEFDGFASRMLQHEMDHLDGVVFTDRAAPIRKKILGSKLNNISKGNVATSYRVKIEK